MSRRRPKAGRSFRTQVRRSSVAVDRLASTSRKEEDTSSANSEELMPESAFRFARLEIHWKSQDGEEHRFGMPVADRK